jgi:hypothetical protein
VDQGEWNDKTTVEVDIDVTLMDNVTAQYFDILIINSNEDFQCYIQQVQDQQNFECTLQDSQIFTNVSEYNLSTGMLELANIDE